MSVSGKKNLLRLLFLLLIGAAAMGYYFYNKGPVNISKASAQEVAAPALYTAFVNDSTAAQKIYSGKVLILSGIISKIVLNQKGKSIILIKTSNNNGFINCTLEEKIPPGIKEDQPVKIKGLCSGLGEADIDLGLQPDLYLERCIIQL